MDFISKLLFAMELRGIFIDGDIDPYSDKFQRFRVQGKSSGKDVFVKIHGNCEGASFGNWNSQADGYTWWEKSYNEITQHEKDERKRAIAANKERQSIIRDKALLRLQEMLCRTFISKDTLHHNYIRKKKFYPF